MTEANKCQKCGGELPLDAPGGLCPRCLLLAGLESKGGVRATSDGVDAREGPTNDNAADSDSIPWTSGSPDPNQDADDFLQVLEEDEHYVFLSEQGRSGMGLVLLARDERLGRDIALKELLPTGLDGGEKTPTPVRHSKEMAGRFLREARITGQLGHRNAKKERSDERWPSLHNFWTGKPGRGELVDAKRRRNL